MLDVNREDAGQNKTSDTELKLDGLSKDWIDIKVKEENECSARQPREKEKTSEVKVFNEVKVLTENIDKLSIEAQDDHVEEDTYKERGPTGGIPVQNGQMINKSNPVRPVCNYMSAQMPHQNEVTMKGNRRTLDDPENQPNKYFRPPAEFGDFNTQLQQGFQFTNQCNFGGCFTGTNDLSQGMVQPVMDDQQFGVNTPPNFVQSPVSPEPMYANNLIADSLLEEIDSPLPISQVNLPNFTNDGQLSNNFDETFCNTKRVKEIGRQSNPVSGLDSDTGSPKQAPSPTSSTNTSSPSVECGCGQSPMHESQSYHGTSPPKYHGVTSPGGFRASPSPANTSGYGSPGLPQLDDGDFDNELFEDAMAVIEADIKTDEMKRNKQRPASVSRQQQVSPTQTMTNNLNIPPILNQNQAMSSTNMVQSPILLAPNQMPPMSTQVLPPSLSNPVPTDNVTAPKQIIIVHQQSQQSQSLIVLPVDSNPPPQLQMKPVTQFKPILPKISQSAGGNMTTTGGSNAGVMMSSNSYMANFRTGAQSNTQAPQQNKPLMLARRKVANIRRKDLEASDEDGDTCLHIAVCQANKHLVQALLERLHQEKLESIVNKGNQKSQTPLYLAVLSNKPDIVATFIRFQAILNVNILAQNLSNDGRKTEVKAAIHVAASQGSAYLRTLNELLKANNILINIANNYGQTALHCAILAHGNAIDSVEIIRTLIKKGADPSAQDNTKGKTPLMYAVEKASLPLVDTILLTVDEDKVKNVIMTQSFDRMTSLDIAKNLKGSLEMTIWNKLWNTLQRDVPGAMSRIELDP